MKLVEQYGIFHMVLPLGGYFRYILRCPGIPDPQEDIIRLAYEKAN